MACISAIATSANLAMSSACFSLFSEATADDRPGGGHHGCHHHHLLRCNSSIRVSAASNWRSRDVTRRHESICRVIFTRSGSPEDNLFRGERRLTCVTLDATRRRFRRVLETMRFERRRAVITIEGPYATTERELLFEKKKEPREANLQRKMGELREETVKISLCFGLILHDACGSPVVVL